MTDAQKQRFQLLSPRYLSKPVFICSLLLKKPHSQIMELCMKYLLFIEFEWGFKAEDKITDR
jgi:hypothetical protein